MSNSQVRIYNRKECIVFRKTNEKYGGLSNMAAGFPLNVNGVPIRTTEALYQLCRFPNDPSIQRVIIEQKSPMTAKMKSKHFRYTSREWDSIKIEIMRWCLRVKLAQNWNKFGELLRTTGELPIVEESKKDDFWGAKPIDLEILKGCNILGRLLMELRMEYMMEDNQKLRTVSPPNISNFLLYGKPIGVIETCANETEIENKEQKNKKGQMELFGE